MSNKQLEESFKREHDTLHPAVHAVESLIQPWHCAECKKDVSLATKCVRRPSEYHIGIKGYYDDIFEKEMEEVFADNYVDCMLFDKTDTGAPNRRKNILFVGYYMDNSVHIWTKEREIGLQQAKSLETKEIQFFISSALDNKTCSSS